MADYRSRHALSGNFIFNVGGNRELTFGVQASNVADMVLGVTNIGTKEKDLYLPSNKIEAETLIVQFICSEDLSEWVYVYKWMLKNKNNSSSSTGQAYENMVPCELTALDADNNPSTRFKYADVFPMTIDALQYSTIGESEVLTFTAVCRYNDFKVVTTDGEEVTLEWNGDIFNE